MFVQQRAFAIYYLISGMQYACKSYNACFIVVVRFTAIKNGNTDVWVGIGFDTSTNIDLAIVLHTQQRISRYATCIRYYNLMRGGMHRLFDKRKKERVSGNGR